MSNFLSLLNQNTLWQKGDEWRGKYKEEEIV